MKAQRKARIATFCEPRPDLGAGLDQSDQESPDYCQFYRAAGQPDSCTFNTTSPPAYCSRGDDYAFAPFQMSRTVATDNNLVCEDYFWTIIGREEGLGGLSSHDD